MSELTERKEIDQDISVYSDKGLAKQVATVINAVAPNYALTPKEVYAASSWASGNLKIARDLCMWRLWQEGFSYGHLMEVWKLAEATVNRVIADFRNA